MLVRNIELGTQLLVILIIQFPALNVKFSTLNPPLLKQKVRFKNHKSSKHTCEVADHFKLFILYKIYPFDVLITTEAFWSAPLFTLFPCGMSERQEFHSKNRIYYNNQQFYYYFNFDDVCNVYIKDHTYIFLVVDTSILLEKVNLY